MLYRIVGTCRVTFPESYVLCMVVGTCEGTFRWSESSFREIISTHILDGIKRRPDVFKVHQTRSNP